MTPGDASSDALGAEASASSDVDLLRAHVDGDPQAFAELVRRHRDRLWAVALRTIGDREEAADAVQDALLAAHRNAARFRGDSAVTTWLHRIVVNACLDRIRRRQAHPTVPLPDGTRSDDRPSGTEPAAPAHDHDTALMVRAALAALPIDQRAAIVLVDVEGYPVAEAAEMLGVAEGTIKSRCARGRARMAITLRHLRSDDPHDKSGRAREASPGDGRNSLLPRGSKPELGGRGELGRGGESGRRGDADRDRAAELGRTGEADQDHEVELGRRGDADRDRAAELGRTGEADQDHGAELGRRGEADQDHGAELGRGGEGGQDHGAGLDHSNAGDTGHAGAGNPGAAESVPSGPAAHGSRPDARDRRDQR